MKKIQKNAARFDNLKQDFLDDKKYSGTAEATLNGYRYDITRFLKFLSDEQLAVNEAGFKRYVIHLTDSGMTANSVNHYIRSVKVFLYWCMEQDEIAPFKIKMVKAQETIKDVYTQEELCALIQPPKRKDSFVVWRSWAIINFILGIAAREATVCEMQMQDISFDDRTIATVYKGNIIKNLIMDCQSYTKYRPNETTGGIFVSWRRKEELPTGA